MAFQAREVSSLDFSPPGFNIVESRQKYFVSELSRTTLVESHILQILIELCHLV